jgi:arylsulfatase A-like enzyme
MNVLTTKLNCAFLLCLLPACLFNLAWASPTKPNILLILADDMGKEWVSAYGAEDIETPHIDALAATGIRFENAYVMPQCTPTRLSLITGQYPFRHGWVNHWDVPRWGGGAHYDWKRNPSIARMLRRAGYATAVAGKWQINDFRIQPEAMFEMGFDAYCMWTGWEGNNPTSRQRYWDPYIHTREGSRTYGGEFGPDLFTEFLLRFIDQNKEGPFFVYYPMVLPHKPFVSTPDYQRASTKLEKHKAMVEYTDKILARFTHKLDALGIRDNTLVIWTTDNGTTSDISGMQDGRFISGGKASTSEPGVCVPFIVNCPEWIPQGRVSTALTDITDVFPTFAELAGAELDPEYIYDGYSIARYIRGESADTLRTFILSMGGKNEARLTEAGVENRYRFRDRVIRDKQFKLFINTRRKPVKLVDLTADPLEEVNLISSNRSDAVAARERLSAIIADFPQYDNDPIYEPLSPQSWDVSITVESKTWKE